MGGLFDISGRHIVVTGASQGIGRRVATFLCGAGATVSGFSLEAPEPPDVVDGLHHRFVDITDPVALEAALVEAETSHGPFRGLINNAGIAGIDRPADGDAADFARLLAVNAIAPGRLTELVADRMRHGGAGGSLINVTTALRRPAFRSAAEYSASKAALESLTRHHAHHWARHNIRVNAIAPGWIRTRLTRPILERGGEAVLRGQIPMRRIGECEDLFGAVLYLLSDASSYMTGSVLTIDGGFSL